MAASRGRNRKIKKDAWDWVENIDCDAITNEHLEKAYRINLACGDKKNHRYVEFRTVGIDVGYHQGRSSIHQYP